MLILLHLKNLLVLFLLFALVNSYAQTNSKDSNNAVLIGNINLNTVIIHVYNSKEDEFPAKEFIILTDQETGLKKAVSANIQGKAITGGFIIVNGIKSKAEIETLAADEMVFNEIVANDVEDFKAYEIIINDYIKKNMVFEDAENEKLPGDSNQVVKSDSNLTTVTSSKTATKTTATEPNNKNTSSKNYTSKSKKVKINFKKMNHQKSNRNNKNKNKKCFSF
jgi:hypothetical protein